jgi:hypothetical protein
MRTALPPFAPVFAEDTTGAVFWLPPAPVDGAAAAVDGAAACFFFAFWAIFTGSSFSTGGAEGRGGIVGVFGVAVAGGEAFDTTLVGVVAGF